MTTAEIELFVEKTLAALPDRTSGNEANRVVAERLEGLVVSNRETLVAYLRGLMSFRLLGGQRTEVDAVQEARVWLALDVTEALSLQELRPDIETLSRDIGTGLVFKPVHQGMVNRYLERLASR